MYPFEASSEQSKDIQSSVPSADRDFSRPNEPFWANSGGLLADDGSVDTDARSTAIKIIQQALAKNPIGPKYIMPAGGPDGIESRHLKDIAIRFGWDVKKKTGKTFVITPCDQISASAFAGAWKALNDYLNPKKQKPG